MCGGIRPPGDAAHCRRMLGRYRVNRSLIAGALGALFVVPAAQAAPVVLNFDVTSGGVTWEAIDNESAASDFNLSGVAGGGSAFAINDASTANNGDAYDDAFAIAVNGETVPTSGGTVDVVAGAAGTTVTADPVVPAGFSANQQLFFFDGDPLVRLFFEITNTGAAATTATIEWATDLGADSNSTVEVDSDGSGVLGSNDRFVVFSDDGANDDPFTLFTFYGGGAGETPSITGLFDQDDVNSLFELFLAPGETKSLLFFGGVFDTVTSSIGEAAGFGSSLTGTLNRLGSDGFLTGLTDAQLATVVNYAVPAPAPLALLGLGLAGLGAARRRRTR